MATWGLEQCGRRCLAILLRRCSESEGLAVAYIWTSVPRRAEVRSDIGRHGVVLDGADEGFIPLLDRTRFCIDPVEMRLQVAVGAGDVCRLRR